MRPELFRAAINEYYMNGHSCGNQITAKVEFNTRTFDKAIKDYFDGKMEAGDIHHKLWEATYRSIGDGILEGGGKIKYNTDDILLINELKTNAAVFAAFKNHSQGKALVDLLLDENGKKRSWTDFRKAASKINDQYNTQWLEAEYNYAIRAARSAVQWKEFERTKDLYPNLEYMRSRSANPRESHKEFYGIIKPIDDPIWDKMLPPNGWGCKCSVRKSKGEVSGKDIEPADQIPGIPGNAGKVAQVFSPEHPMVQGVTKDERGDIKSQLRGMYNLEDDYARLPVGKSGDVIAHSNADRSDLILNKDFAVAMVKKFKADVEIRIDVQDGRKNPEFKFEGVIGDRTKWNKAKSADKYVHQSFRNKLKEGGQLRDLKSSWIALDFDGKLTSDNFGMAARQLWAKMARYDSVSFVILKNGKKLSRIERGGEYGELLAKIKKELL